jgi:FtsK/SpoIIIE family
MSDTRSEAVERPASGAALAAAALVRAAARSSAHRRLLLTSHLGITPATVMAELAALASGIVEIAGQELAAVSAGTAELVPYLVVPPGSPLQGNAGSQGFAARLRNVFADGSTGPRVLLILDPDPVETVRTTSEDASALPELAFGALCASAAAGAPESAADLIAAVAADFATRADPDAGALDRLAQFASESWSTRQAAAAELHRLGYYIGDPRETGFGLRYNAARRLTIERALAPDKDLGRELARQGFNTAILPTLVNARGATGLDYSRFTLADLVAPDAPPVPRARFATPLAVTGAAASHAGPSRVAAWLPGGGELRITLDRPLAPGQALTAAWAGGGSGPCSAEPDPPSAVLACDGSGGWGFGEVSLISGGVTAASISVGVYTGAGTWFPVDDAIDIDTGAGAFRVDGEPRLIAIAPGGSILSPLAAGLGPPGSLVQVVTRYAGEEHTIPLLLLGEGPGGGDAAGSSAGGEPGDGNGDGEDDGGDSDDGGEPGAAQGSGEEPALGADAVDPSPVHTALRFAAAGAPRGIAEFAVRTPEPGTLQAPPEAAPFEGWRAGLIQAAGVQRAFLAAQSIEGCDGLELERTVLDQPGTLAFTLARDGGTSRAVPHPTFERLRLPESPQVRQFQDARQALFASLLAGPGTAYGAAAPECRGAAVEYCAAFAALLAELPDEGAYQRHFDRLVLCDAIEDPTSGSVLFAPTSPLTVAFYVALAEQADSWIAGGALPLPGDLDDVGCQYLAPFASVGGTWYEAAPPPGAPFLWRRLRPVVRTAGAAGGDPKLIARRLEAFLRVFDVYADRRHTLSVAFHDPGDATGVVQALRAFYRRGAAAGGPLRPHLDAHLVVPDRERPPRAIEEFLSNRSGDSSEADLLAQGRVRLHVWEPDDELPFCHVSFVFRSATAREIRQVGMADRAPTTFAGGLAASPGRHIVTAPNERIFYWGTFAARPASATPGASGAVLASVTERLNELVGGQGDRLHPGMTAMAATTIPAEFMERVYDSSAWVVHLDRMLGLEAFTPHEGAAARRYLVDYEDAADRGAGYDAITATTRIEPYLDALGRALAGDLDPTDAGLRAVLDAINAVSGRWAIQLLRDAPNMIRERVGTIAAIAAIRDLDRTFADPGSFTAVIALKPDVLTSAELRAAAPPLARPACDDLAIINVVLGGTGPVAVRARLVEVKFQTAGGADEGRARLQLDNIRAWLTTAFAPAGPGAPFRGRDLANLLRSATARARVFGLGAGADDATAERALAAIAAGDYTFDCEYWVGGERLQGDVISLQLDSTVTASRSALAGDGAAYGLIRLGRPAFEQVASGAPLDPQPWERATFEAPPPPTPARARPPGPPDPAGGAGPGTPGAPPAPPTPPETAAEVADLARALDQAARKYGLDLEPIQTELAQAGPTVIRFRTRPLGRQTLKGVQQSALDVGREIGAATGVIVAQEPYFITIDVPRRHPQVVNFAEHLALLEGAAAQPGALPFLLGMAPSGEVAIEDLAHLPHLLIAGATGSGKSVLLRGIVASLVHERPPSELQLVIIDPKQVDFLIFDDLPHLYGGRLVTDPLAAVTVLGDTIEQEIERRRPLLRAAGATSALEYYEQGGSRSDLPQLVVVIDEFADLAGALSRAERQDFLGLVQRYGQLTRAFGIYLVLATQRPSVQVITGEIKANLTARVALRVQSYQDSMTILGQVGAERLGERGDMLFSHGSRLERLQGFLVTPRDAEAAGTRWR